MAHATRPTSTQPLIPIRIQSWSIGWPRPWELSALASLVLLAALLRFRGLGSQALWLDEAWTHDLANVGFHGLIGRISEWESTPPLYYLANRLVRAAGGDSAFWLRFVSALTGSLTVPAVWLAARLMISARAALIAATFCACSPLMWWYSQEARAYALATFLTAVGLVGFAMAMRRLSVGSMLVLSLASGLAIATEYLAGLPIAITYAILFVRKPGERRRVLAATAVPLVIGLVLLPMALHQRSLGLSSWIERLPFGVRAAQVPVQAWLGHGVARSFGSLVVSAVIALLVCSALVLLARAADQRARRAIADLSLIAIGSAAILATEALFGLDLVLARNLLMAWPAAVVAVGGCLAVLGRRRCAAITVLLASVMLILILRAESDPALQRIDWRPVPGLLGPVPERGRIVVLQGFSVGRPLTVYAKGLGVVPGGRADVGELALVSARLPQPRICWWGGVCSDGIRRDNSTMPVGRKSILGLKRSSTAEAGGFTVVLFRSSQPRRITVAGVRHELPRGSNGAVLLQRR